MSSTYSSYKIELIGTGEQAGTWGTTTNTNLGTALEQAIGGYVSVTFTGLTKTLTLTNTNAAQDARALYLNLIGSPGGTATLELPAIQKAYIIKNSTTGGYTVTAKVTGMTGVVIPNGSTMMVYNNGTDVVVSVNNFNDGLTLGTTVLSANSASDALRITQIGSGNALVVEDEANPDSSRFQIDSTGRVSIGTTTPGVSNLRINRTLTGGSAGASVYLDYTVASDVTGSAASYRSDVTTQATAFTLPFLIHYGATALTVGAGSTVTDQRGFSVSPGAVGATNNYGLYSFLPAAGTNNWNIFNAGTAPNYMASALGIGSTTLAGYKIRTGSTLDGSGGGAADIYTNSTILSSVTSIYYGHRSLPATQATAFTLPAIYHFVAESVSVGAGSTVTSQIGFYAPGTGATNNYGFYTNIAASGSNNWGFYNVGTAPNYMAGNLGIGSTSLTGFRVRISGASGDTGSGTASAVYVNPTFDSTVTNFGYVFRSSPTTTAAAYTLGALYHYLTDTTTVGAGSTLSNNYLFFGSNTSATGTNNYSFYSNVAPSALNSWNLYFTANVPSYMVGALGIGTTTLTGYNLHIARQLTGATTSYAVGVTSQTQSDVTTASNSFISAPSTQATAFTLPAHYHYVANDISIGAGSTVTNQRGFTTFTHNNATNNFGFYGGVNTGAGSNWNFYANGTAPNYMAGALGIGSTNVANLTNLRISRNLTGGATQYSIMNQPQFMSDVLTQAVVYRSFPSTEAAAFTLPSLIHYVAENTTIGAGSAVAIQYGFFASSLLTGATNNYGFYGNIFAAANTWNFYGQGTANNYMAGALGIGTTTLTGYNLSIGRQLTGATTAASVRNVFTSASDVTAAAYAFQSQITTAAAAYTLASALNYVAEGINKGAGSTVTNQFGFTVSSGYTAATNNYGFRSDIAAGANNWNLYNSGTAKNYMAGSLGIGDTSSTSSLAVNKNLTGGTIISQVQAAYTVQSDVTAFASSFDSFVQTQFTAFTLGSLAHYRASGLVLGGGGSAVTNQYCFYADNIFDATNNYGFYAAIDAGTNKWNFYASATANNAFRGNSRFGDLTAPVATVDVTGNVAATTSILSTGGTSGVGYATGAGGAVTQLTSRTTGVTLNKVSGAITLVSAAGSAAYQTFTVTNSAVAATDVVIVNQKSGTDKYITMVTAVAAGSFQITFATTGGTTTEQPVFNFAVIKAVAA